MPRASCTTPATTCMASCPPTEARHDPALAAVSGAVGPAGADLAGAQPEPVAGHGPARRRARPAAGSGIRTAAAAQGAHPQLPAGRAAAARSEEHTSELQSLMRISYAVICLKKKPHEQTLSPLHKTPSPTGTGTTYIPI